MKETWRSMGWGFRVDREGNLHDAFPPMRKEPKEERITRRKRRVRTRTPRARLA